MTGTKAVSRMSAFLCLCVISGLFLLPLLSGCSPSPPPTPTPTKTPKPPATPTVPPTATPTTVPPTATPKPTATLTPISVQLPTATSTPPPTPTPKPTSSLGVCPLTGEGVSDIAVLDRRPLAVKISNFPPIVRPQAGLSYADVVFEHLSEAGLTRLTAVFLSKDVEKVGSIRSARLLDLEIPAMFKAMFAYSGASGGVKQKIMKSDFFDRVISPDYGHPGFRYIPSEGKAYEHTLFSDTQALWEIAEERGLNERQDLSGWTFSEEPPEGGSPATSIETLYMPKYSSAEYQYDPGREAYLRSIFGEPHGDELTGEQIAARNVVVLYANHLETDIVEDSTGPRIYYSIEIQLWGEGRAIVFRDGQAFEGRWVRPQRPDLIRFVDDTGTPIPLKPGNTWIQVVPLDFEIEVNRD
ncbi:MAG: DUF3048 domain-containing protein [Anaerolineales bacterium]|nr:DUF3048 domain-containing protein [Anaerolineales bacterium]